MLSNVKLVFLLYICHKLNDILLITMLKQYTKKRIVAARYYFNLIIKFYEQPNINKFKINDISCKIFNSSKNVLLKALQNSNLNILSKFDILTINNNLVSLNISLNSKQLIAIYSIATIIKLYKKKKFKYVFIPITVDYGRDSSSLHQTGLIIDLLNNRIIFYEPYGKYKKYGLSYKNTLKPVLSCFRGVCDMENIQYITYHDLLNIKSPYGIQNIIMSKNNLNNSEFINKYNSIKKEININFPNIKIPNINDLDDKNINIVELMYTLVFTSANIDRYKKKDYYDLINKSLELYYYYNSKTCVSITIIEMNLFFKLSETLNLNDIERKIKEKYLEFNTVYPNTIIMADIYKILELSKNKKKIINMLSRDIELNNVCKKI